jgi:hypothetical protein
LNVRFREKRILSPVEQLYALVTVCTVVEQTLQCIKQPYECAASQNEFETARSEQAGDRYDQVDEKYSEITYHGLIVTKASQMTRPGNLSDLCQE